MFNEADSSSRLAHLDGMRCVAVMGVVLYHYLVRWAAPIAQVSLYPFGDRFSNLPFVKHGSLGVELFFIISGFVIALTLTRCRNIAEFAVRRYARLAPPMLFFSALTFAVLTIVPGAPFPTSPRWFFSSITFIDPSDAMRIVRSANLDSIDGVYWSLYVEVKFYAIAAALYFWRKRHFHWWLCAFALLSEASRHSGVPSLVSVADLLLIPQEIPWFLLGVSLFQRYRGDATRSYLPGMILAVALLPLVKVPGHPPPAELAEAVVVFVFWLGMSNSVVQRLLSARFMTAIGAASYSLYLFHQYVGVTLLRAAGSYGESTIGGLVLVGVVTVVVTLVALAGHRILEVPSNRLIVGLWRRYRSAANAIGSSPTSA